MKTLKRFAFIAAVIILTAFRCSDDEQLTLSLEANQYSLTADGTSVVKFTVYEGNADVTAQSMIYEMESGQALQGNTFSTKVAGSYYFYAEYDGRKTDHIEVIAEEVVASSFVRQVCLMEFTDAQCTFCPNASRYIDRNILQKRNDVHLMAFHEKDQWSIEQYADLRTKFGFNSTPYGVVDMRQALSLDTDNIDKVLDAINTSVKTYSSHCGVAVSSSINGGTCAKVTAKLYSEKNIEYRIVVYVVEDGIIGAQLDNGLTKPEYYHQFVVRKMVSSSIYGERLGRVPSKTEISKEYDITIDPSWNLEKTYVYVLATDDDGYVNNMQVCLLDGGSAGYEYKN